ncbi:uncharacterized protein B0T15DRAFT_577746 [Chaetomium strumarium]|uniref:Uncharacterized protein n=1 Tax=Chaetomium strumarium TaxID=1170767 RepID=A0AAJ0LYU2_9PEZI|nr:hypothetical protein B0T15DRAFT_577746 [Chaetomium strumarium]
MHPLSTISILAIAGIAGAAPAPAQLDERAGFWSVAGWGGPNCQGSLLWAYTGTGNWCQNVPTLAASVSTSIKQNTQFEWRPTANCGIISRDDADANSTVSALEVGHNGGNALAARQTTNSCSNAPVLAFKVTFV